MTRTRRISKAQQGIHKNLECVVKKHLNSTHQKPVAEHTQQAFDKIKPLVDEALAAGRPLIFDSGCGTAMSTRILAEQNPHGLILGIDRSASRLKKEYNRQLPQNAHLIRAECADFWHLASRQGWKLSAHKILYPNPYPKSKHLKRRWHGHPAFSDMLALGGEIELRTNWKVYADEFCAAINLANKSTLRCQGVEVFIPQKPLTLFEKKYHDAGQPLWRVFSK